MHAVAGAVQDARRAAAAAGPDAPREFRTAMVDVPPEPRFLPSGDGGLTVEFGQSIDEATSRAVVALADALDAKRLPGLREVVPTYRSLLVMFDPVALPRAELIAAIVALRQAEGGVGAAGIADAPRWRVPVRYGGTHGADLGAVAQHHGLSEEAVVALHCGTDYRVYMIGFAPGFSYLGGLPEALHTDRRRDPRPKTPPRSVSIGGQQAAVSPPLEIPSGWHLLGQTPVRTYDPRRAGRPFLFAPGDMIRFEPIGASDYAALCAAAEHGEVVAVRDRSRG